MPENLQTQITMLFGQIGTLHFINQAKMRLSSCDKNNNGTLGSRKEERKFIKEYPETKKVTANDGAFPLRPNEELHERFENLSTIIKKIKKRIAFYRHFRRIKLAGLETIS